MAGIVKRRRIVLVGAALCVVIGLAPAPAGQPAQRVPESVEGGSGALYCTLAWIFRCYAQPSCVPAGCGVNLPGWGF